METKQIRQRFLDYFSAQEHKVYPSSHLVPAENDATLLFTNAGMVQFKGVFLGTEKLASTRACTSQLCLRAGGKHNDLDNVGKTPRHHTLFEMLGNFSFGDYCKEQAIRYAWDFLTQVLNLPAERLWVTVYEKDQEAEDIWLNTIGIDPNRFSRCGDKDNFWSMGDTGPCGPCSEIFYDHGDHLSGGPPGSPDEDGERYVEVWNLVFMQYERDQSGNLTPLPKPSVDTGMGLERIAAVMQGVHDNYETDLFKALLKAVQALSPSGPIDDIAARVIADHIRATVFLLTEHVRPSNEGRGYVLRRIMRRAIRYGYQQGMRDPFMHKLVPVLVREMGEAYPQLVTAETAVVKAVLREEKKFAATLDQGLGLLATEIENLAGSSKIPGDTVFKLYDTYGFPVDLTEDIAAEQGLTVDHAGFDAAMDKQRETSQQHQKFAYTKAENLDVSGKTEFMGYQEQHTDLCKVLAIFVNGDAKDTLTTADQAVVVLDKTPFYAESGGQVGDAGVLLWRGGEFRVADTQKQGDVICHFGELKQGNLSIGDTVRADVASERTAIACNHSATHLLHAALRHVLGNEVIQKGSLVTADKLRFDFTFDAAVSQEQLKAIEDLVNRQIRANHTVETTLSTPEEAIKNGALALFSEKYAGEVRVLRMGDFSCELCGGTHVAATGDIGLFKIINETSVAAGVRRIEALTAQEALDWVRARQDQLQQLASALKTDPMQVKEKLTALQARCKTLEKAASSNKHKSSQQEASELLSAAIGHDGAKLVIAQASAQDPKALRSLVDELRSKTNSAVIALAVPLDDGKVRLITAVTKDLQQKLAADDLVRQLAASLQGSGGGRSDMAQGVGQDASQLASALESLPEWIKAQLDT